MDFFIGGYYLVQGRQKANWMNKDLLPSKLRSAKTDVLNGIAYDREKKRLLVTGKYWPKIFHIELIPKRPL